MGIKNGTCHSCLPTVELVIGVSTMSKVYSKRTYEVKNYKMGDVRDSIDDWLENKSRPFVSGISWYRLQDSEGFKLGIDISKRTHRGHYAGISLEKSCKAVANEIEREISYSDSSSSES